MRQHRASDVECPGQKQRSPCLSRGALTLLIMTVDQVSGLSISQLESSDTPCEGQAHCSIDKAVVLVVLHALPAQSAAL